MTTRAQRVPTLLLTPVCPDCGREIELVRIEPARPGYDMQTFDCADCGYSKNVEFKIDRQVSAARLSR